MPMQDLQAFIETVKYKLDNDLEWTENERDSMAIICEEPTDLSTLIRELKTRQKLFGINLESLHHTQNPTAKQVDSSEEFGENEGDERTSDSD